MINTKNAVPTRFNQTEVLIFDNCTEKCLLCINQTNGIGGLLRICNNDAEKEQNFSLIVLYTFPSVIVFATIVVVLFLSRKKRVNLEQRHFKDLENPKSKSSKHKNKLENSSKSVNSTIKNDKTSAQNSTVDLDFQSQNKLIEYKNKESRRTAISENKIIKELLKKEKEDNYYRKKYGDDYKLFNKKKFELNDPNRAYKVEGIDDYDITSFKKLDYKTGFYRTRDENGNFRFDLDMYLRRHDSFNNSYIPFKTRLGDKNNQSEEADIKKPSVSQFDNGTKQSNLESLYTLNESSNENEFNNYDFQNNNSYDSNKKDKISEDMMNLNKINNLTYNDNNKSNYNTPSQIISLNNNIESLRGNNDNNILGLNNIAFANNYNLNSKYLKRSRSKLKLVKLIEKRRNKSSIVKKDSSNVDDCYVYKINNLGRPIFEINIFKSIKKISEVSAKNDTSKRNYYENSTSIQI
jgi:hypothetical protein